MRFIKYGFLLLICCIAGLFFLGTGAKPLVDAKSHHQVGNAEKVQVLFEQLTQGLRHKYRSQTIVVTQEQAESLAGFAQRALPKISGSVQIQRSASNVYFSYQLPSSMLSRYLNIQVMLVPDSKLNIQSITIGSITLPGNITVRSLVAFVNWWTDSNIASIATQQVQKVSMTDNSMSFTFGPLDPILREIKVMQNASESDTVSNMQIKVAHYLRLLDQTYIVNDSTNSLGHYLQAVMKEAQLLSKESSATMENEAAIMALAIFAGNRRFVNLVGDVSFAVDPLPRIATPATLNDREDLSLHFIFSAGIKLASEQGISVAIGEFKELMDRRKGGSGYSFVDLAADMAGAQFAASAVDPQKAQNIQAILSSSFSETLFFPDISGLEEGMSKDAFAKKYKEVDSEQYQLVVKEIEERLSKLHIHQ